MKDSAMKDPEIEVRITPGEVSWLGGEDRWRVMLEVSFKNIGGGKFELDKRTACEGGRISNRVFQVQMGDTEVQYQGMMAKRAHPGPDGFFRIAAGEELKVDVDLGDQYAFPKEGGNARVTFDHANHFSIHRVQLQSPTIEIALAK